MELSQFAEREIWSFVLIYDSISQVRFINFDIIIGNFDLSVYDYYPQISLIRGFNLN